MSRVQFSLPNDEVTKDLIERVQFSVSSRNAGSKVSECLTHVFVSPYCDDPKAVAWQHVSSGVTCLLRKKELAKNGRKMIWTVHMCLYNVTYGVLVWKGAIAPNSCYTAVADNFHVYVMHELNAIVGILFDEASQAREMLRSYLEWDAEKVKEERGGKSEASSTAASRFEKTMISKPCNFQHIQGTQALDECLEIEKIKTDIQAVFFGVGSTRARKDMEHRSKGKRKKDAGKPRIQLQNVSVPHKASASGIDHKFVHSSKSLDFNMIHPTSPTLHSQASVPMEMGLNHSMPLQSLHLSQPDLLNGYQEEHPPQPSGRLSPPYDSLPCHSEMLPDNQPQISEPRSPQYDSLPLKETKPQLPLQNGSGVHSPQYDSVTKSRDGPHSPIYDSLQKTNLHLVNQQQEFIPELYVDAIVDSEVSGYTAVGRDANQLDYTPPERLSPLNFEKEFSHTAFFHPSFVTSTTNC